MAVSPQRQPHLGTKGLLPEHTLGAPHLTLSEVINPVMPHAIVVRQDVTDAAMVWARRWHKARSDISLDSDKAAQQGCKRGCRMA